MSTVVGNRPYRFVPDQYGLPLVTAGFEPLDILQAIAMLLDQIRQGRCEVENQYTRVVRDEGNPVALRAIGDVFDLKAERKREDLQIDRDGRTITERISITLKNAKAEAATVRVLEGLFRWTDWEMVDSSEKFVKRNAQTASFDMTVPAGGERTLRYTVRYRWAADVKIP